MRKYETFSTTADMGIRFKGRDFPELYANALRGLNVLLFGSNRRPPSGGERLPFRFQGDSPENVLVNLLCEVLFQVYHRKRRVASAFIRRADRGLLDADLLLASFRRTPRVEAKSVTYHNLHVEKKGGELSAAVVFDV